MKRKNINYRWIPVLLWMGMIFILSHQDSSRSSELSGGLMLNLIDILTGLFRNFDVDPEVFHFLLRKGAHFTAYLILGLFVTHAVDPKEKKAWIWTLLICILYAASDEYHQSFIPGRSGELRDVLIDSSGSLMGIMIFTLIRSFIEKPGKKNFMKRAS